MDIQSGRDHQMLGFERLTIANWRQFENVDMRFHRHLTVITGANGAGKSTLLSILFTHFGWNRTYLSTPRQNKDGSLLFESGIFGKLLRSIRSSNLHEGSIGRIVYSNGHTSNIGVPVSGQVQYGLNFSSIASVQGMHVDSHRPIGNYQSVGNLNIGVRDHSHFYDQYNNDSIQNFAGARTNPIFRLKEALISMAVFGEGNSRVDRNQTLIDAYDGFISVLRIVLPEAIGFQDISIRSPDVVLVTKTGEFMIDAASGGLISLIDLCWRIHLYSIGKQYFVVTMDEPENHLHPSLQRTLLPRLLKAFPNAQFIIATHSPFMVTSVRDSSIYVLRHGAIGASDPESAEGATLLGQRTVFSELLDTADRAGTASQTLRDVLGVPATTPEWVEQEIEAIVRPFLGRPANPEAVSQIKRELASRGLEDRYTDALDRINL